VGGLGTGKQEEVNRRMADELGDLCKRISLTEGERDGIQVEELDVSEARVIAGKCLIWKIWSDKNVNQEAFKTVFSNIWRIVGSVKFKELQDNIWLFEFSNEGDKRRVLDGRPWSFNRQILVLNEFDGSIPPSQLEFRHSPFWVQVHEMPLLCMNKNVGTKIGNSLGILEDVDVAGNGLGWGSYLRLRVSLDVMKPLDRGRALNFAGKSTWVEFKYEKLPLFCFRCGRIVHGSRGCPVPPATHVHDRENPKQWGSWLRASDPKRKGAKTGMGFGDGGVNSSQSGEGGKADGAQSDERILGMASSVFFGNPTRKSTPVSPARSAGSATFHTRDSRCVLERKEKGQEACPEILSKKKGHGSGERQYEYGITGLDMGRSEASLGPKNIGESENDLLGNDMGRSATSLGLNNLDSADHHSLGQEAVCETANMEITLMAMAEAHPGDGHADLSTPKLNIKKWKRMARHGNQSRVLPQASRKAKRGRAEIDVSQPLGLTGSEKRQKMVDETHGQSAKILAAAVVQPRQEP
jgi:hypothetical protein